MEEQILIGEIMKLAEKGDFSSALNRCKEALVNQPSNILISIYFQFLKAGDTFLHELPLANFLIENNNDNTELLDQYNNLALNHALRFINQNDPNLAFELLKKTYIGFTHPNADYHHKHKFIEFIDVLASRSISPTKNDFDLLIQYSMPRTGSTFIWQILDKLIPGKVFKTHNVFSPNFPVISTVRDPRDMLVSSWRRDNPDTATKLMTVEEIQKGAQTIVDDFQKFYHYKKRFPKNKFLVLKYEDFTTDIRRIIRPLCEFLGTDAANEITAAAEVFSSEKNKKISNRLGNFSNYDRKTMLHGNHINNGKIGYWKEHISDSNKDLIEELLLQPLKLYQSF